MSKVRKTFPREASFDCHGLTREEALDAVSKELDRAFCSRKERFVVIHGAGAVLKPLMMALLQESPLVNRVVPAGLGATVAFLEDICGEDC